MNRVIVDANIILRYLLNDIELQSRKAAHIIETQSVLLPTEVLCEVVYVLDTVYDVERAMIAETLVKLFDSGDVETDNIGVLLHALAVFRQSKLDFVDCLLCSYNQVEAYTIETFDKKLLSRLRRS